LENVIIKFVADTSGLEPAIKQLELLGKISKDDAAAFAQVNNEQKEFIQNLNKSTTEMGKLSNEVDGLMAEIQAGVMEGFADHLAEVTKESKQAATGFKSIKAELKELKAQIASGNLGEKELRAATKRAGELADAIADANQQVKAFEGNRFERILTRASEGARALSAGMAAAAGAQALFGSENEDFNKTLVKVQGSMALLQGTQELTMLLQKESALMIGLNEAKTYALAAAQRVAGAASTALGVQIAASTAVATAGLSLLLAGMAYLIVTMDDARESATKMNKALADDAGVRQKANDKLISMLKDGLDKELLMNKQAHQREILELDKKFRAKTLSQEAYQDAVRIEDDLFLSIQQQTRDKFAKQEADAAKKAADEKLKKVREAYAAEAKALQDWRDKRQQMLEEMKQASIDMEMAEVEDKINARKKDQNDFDQQILDRMDKQKAANDLELERLKALMSETTAVRKMSTQEYTQFAIQQATVLSNTIFTINQQNRDAETASILESLSERKDAELANKNLTDAQRLQIEERYAQQEAEIKTRAWEAQKQAATMQAIINGALAIGNILATVPGGPLSPATIASLAAAAIATGAQIAVIQNAQPPKFADGGMVGGQLHSSGGTLIEAERGEYVINRQSTSDYLPSLKVLNSGEVEPTFANNILTALANGTFDLAAQFQTKQSASSDGINYDKLDRIMAKHKSNLNVNIDEQGLTTFLLKENSRVEFRNKKMRYRA